MKLWSVALLCGILSVACLPVSNAGVVGVHGLAPLPPVALAANSGPASGTVQLSWTQAPTGIDQGAIAYVVFRNGSPIATVSSNSYVGPLGPIADTYYVETKSPDGMSAPSNPVFVASRTACDASAGVPPVAPGMPPTHSPLCRDPQYIVNFLQRVLPQCSLADVTIAPQTFPYIFYGFHDECWPVPPPL